ncbi:MAG: T9SS type A sorting domain-containing protein [Prevotella sp.]|nr:T9SS type A sorting domain-containing protein [Prevotella sp.]
MKRNILVLAFGAALLLCVPVQLRAESLSESAGIEVPAITVAVNEATVHVTGATGEVLQVYNVAGVRVMSVKIEDPDKYFDLNLPKGCYIIKVGKVVRKISIR